MSIHDEAAWEERYREVVWTGEANRALVDEAAGLPAGKALDAGCGEGGDALWLAGQGWHVTAVDFSTTALLRGRTRACELGLDGRIDFRHADLRTWTPPPGRFDLVTAHYLHLPSAIRGPLFERLAASVAPGGTLLVVGHLLDHGNAHDHGHEHGAGEQGHAHDPDMMFTAEDVAATLDPAEWVDVVTATSERSAAAVARTGNPAPDTVLVARRRSGAG
jgi:SAM-dependent methyltransferase